MKNLSFWYKSAGAKGKMIAGAAIAAFATVLLFMVCQTGPNNGWGVVESTVYCRYGTTTACNAIPKSDSNECIADNGFVVNTCNTLPSAAECIKYPNMTGCGSSNPCSTGPTTACCAADPTFAGCPTTPQPGNNVYCRYSGNPSAATCTSIPTSDQAACRADGGYVVNTCNANASDAECNAFKTAPGCVGTTFCRYGSNTACSTIPDDQATKNDCAADNGFVVTSCTATPSTAECNKYPTMTGCGSTGPNPPQTTTTNCRYGGKTDAASCTTIPTSDEAACRADDGFVVTSCTANASTAECQKFSNAPGCSTTPPNPPQNTNGYCRYDGDPDNCWDVGPTEEATDSAACIAKSGEFVRNCTAPSTLKYCDYGPRAIVGSDTVGGCWPTTASTCNEGGEMVSTCPNYPAPVKGGFCDYGFGNCIPSSEAACNSDGRFKTACTDAGGRYCDFGQPTEYGNGGCYFRPNVTKCDEWSEEVSQSECEASNKSNSCIKDEKKPGGKEDNAKNCNSKCPSSTFKDGACVP